MVSHAQGSCLRAVELPSQHPKIAFCDLLQVAGQVDGTIVDSLVVCKSDDRLGRDLRLVLIHVLQAFW